MKVLVLIPFLMISSVSLNAQNSVVTIEAFAGMSGCWERSEKAKNLLVSEQWMKPAGTSMIGMGRTVKNGKTVDYEFMRIEQRTDGVFFVAKPKANTNETEFKLKSSTSREFVFESPEHDFPQRVIYKLNGKVLIGRIEGTQNGKSTGIDFPFEKVKCD